MKKGLVYLIGLFLILGFSTSASAVPNTGLAPTNGGPYIGCQDWSYVWTNGDGDCPADADGGGFFFDSNITAWLGGNNLKQFNQLVPAENPFTSEFIYLFSTFDFDDSVTFYGREGGDIPSTSIDGYVQPGSGYYHGWALPALSFWQDYGEFSTNSFPCQEGGITSDCAESVYGRNKVFYFLSGTLNGAELPIGEYLFLVADLDNDGIFNDGARTPNGGGTDFIFTPKTTSMTGVPEPATLLLFGTGLLGASIFRRKFYRKHKP